MSEALRQVILGVGAILLAPAHGLQAPGMRITLPCKDATSAIAHDFSVVSKDLTAEIKREEESGQLALIEGELFPRQRWRW